MDMRLCRGNLERSHGNSLAFKGNGMVDQEKEKANTLVGHLTSNTTECNDGTQRLHLHIAFFCSIHPVFHTSISIRRVWIKIMENASLRQ
jgi:hypothetical protein